MIKRDVRGSMSELLYWNCFWFDWEEILSFLKSTVMTRYIKISRFVLRRALYLFLLSFMNVITFAQDKGIDVDINVKKEHAWYQQPWIWVVGAAIFILLLVALLRSGGARNKG